MNLLVWWCGGCQAYMLATGLPHDRLPVCQRCGSCPRCWVLYRRGIRCVHEYVR